MRSARLCIGFVVGVGLLGAALVACAQTPSKDARISVAVDAKADVAFDAATKTITVTPRVAVLGKGTEFRWVVGRLPAGYTVEFDFRVHEGRKGPFVRPGSGATGRYKGESESEVRAGAVANAPRDAWKYDVVVRDASGNDVAGIDPMIIVAE
jgi:hypothetical protein